MAAKLSVALEAGAAAGLELDADADRALDRPRDAQQLAPAGSPLALRSAPASSVSRSVSAMRPCSERSSVTRTAVSAS